MTAIRAGFWLYFPSASNLTQGFITLGSAKSTRPRSKRAAVAKVTGTGSFRPPVRSRFGQHFLEPAWITKTIQVIRPVPGDRFIEIGPGKGQLTFPIAKAGARVVALEVDRDLATQLREASRPRVQVITGDVLERDLAGVVASVFGANIRARLVGNLPYNLSSPILGSVLRAHRRTGCFLDATLMLQLEVAERLTSAPGDRTYGPLAIFTFIAAEAERALVLPPGAFRPVPEVRSALVRLRFRPSPIPVPNPELFERLVRSLFTQRRKMLLNALLPMTKAIGTDSPRVLLDRAGLSPERRPATLDLKELVRLTETVASAPGF